MVFPHSSNQWAEIEGCSPCPSNTASFPGWNIPAFSHTLYLSWLFFTPRILPAHCLVNLAPGSLLLSCTSSPIHGDSDTHKCGIQPPVL
jgi:hypothetical protein